MLDRKINIGITIIIEEKDNGIFSNGIRQNIISLRNLLDNCNNVENSYIINIANFSNYKGTSWEQYSKNIISLKQAETMCDLIVICNGYLSEENCTIFAQLKKKIVKLVFGAEVSMFNERVLFDQKQSGIYSRNNMVDAVWLSPHFFERDRFFHEARYCSPTYLANYIWDPMFIEKHVDVLKNSPRGGFYKPSETIDKRISTLEPNINLVKTNIVPIITTELFYKKYPHLLKFFSAFGGLHTANKKDMIDFVKQMTIHKDKKCFFEARYPVVWTLSDHTDILLCHQSQCELNYLYLDAAWLGYPVVHNSPMMKELGWYYPENDSEKAIEHLKYIAENFDTVEYPDNKYLNKSREFAKQYLPTNPENIKGYEELIDKLYEGDFKTSKPMKISKKKVEQIDLNIQHCKKLSLPQVTLVIADCVDYTRARRVLDHCQKLCNFGEIKFFTHFINPNDLQIINIEKLDSVDKYSDFMIKKLVKYINTKFILIVQHDGFIIDPSKWTDEFLEYDYIGAPWHPSMTIFEINKEYLVGNGGFCFQTKKLVDFLSKDSKFDNCYPAGDAIICQKYREYLEFNGFKFAPVDLADRFSCESYKWENTSFGQHSWFKINENGVYKMDRNYFEREKTKDVNKQILADPAVYIVNIETIGDVIASAPAIKWAIDNFHQDGNYYVLVPKIYRELFQFVDSDKLFCTREKTQFPNTYYFRYLWDIHQPRESARVTGHRMHLAQFAAIRFTDRILSNDQLRYLPLPEVSIDHFNIDFSKAVLLTTTYCSKQRTWADGALVEIVNYIKQKGYLPIYLGKRVEEKESNSGTCGTLEQLPECGIDLRDKTTLLELSSIMKNSKAIVGIDNGLIHLAGTTEIPIVCGYTVATPETRIPLRVKGQTYAVCPSKDSCRFCLSNWQMEYFQHTTCYYGHNECVKQMTSDKFIQCLEQIL